jgi:antirestriction protein ArdC
MAGTFVCASLGIVPTVRHADYIGSWINQQQEIIWSNAASPGRKMPSRFRAKRVLNLLQASEGR